MIDKGSFIRKKNWNFFTNYYLSGQAEFVPSIEIMSILQHKPGTISVHGMGFDLDELVEITKEEHIRLNEEFKAMDLVVSNNDANCHIRKDNGQVKIAHEKGESLRYCFSFNNKEKNRGYKMSSYICPVCNNIHCGTSIIES